MGTIEVTGSSKQLVISSHIITYGNATSSEITERIREEIETMWNEPHGRIFIDGNDYQVQFRITAACKNDLSEMDVLQNINPLNNYFRIEEFVHGRISFVDGLGCNSGYFLLENLYQGSTTAAHEYGHTLGLEHPRNLDIRGTGVPSIMYPRGTLVDSAYQYDPTIPAGQKGGTMHPMYRKVKQEDIDNLQLHRLNFKNNKAVVGEFTNVYHWNHADGGAEDFYIPPIFG